MRPNPYPNSACNINHQGLGQMLDPKPVRLWIWVLGYLGQIADLAAINQPPSFIDTSWSNHVCQFRRALYGLRQTLLAWFDRFGNSIVTPFLLEHC